MIARNAEKMKRNLIANVMVLPAMLLFIVFVIVPAVQSLVTSFTDWNGLSASKYVGLQNYVDIFTSPDSRFYIALQNNMFWLVFGTILPIVIGLIQANLLVRGRVKYSNVFQLIFFLPQIVSVTVACVIWGWIFDPLTGPVNAFLQMIGLEHLQQSWLGDPKLVMTSLLVIFVWLAYGFCTVVFCAAIQGVDTQLYEAATVDGCGRWRQFWHITLPGIRTTLNTVTLLQIIGSFQVFDIIFIMTKGGPGFHSLVLSYYIYNEGFGSQRVGFASAVSIALAVILFAVTIVYTKVTERMEN